MEPALKQRLWGAVILVALAVIFLPMLIQGPAPDSGVADVPLTMPNAPAGEYETRELPLVTPGEVPEGGAVGMDTTHPDAADPAVATPGVSAPAPASADAPVSQPVPLGADGVSAPSALPAESTPAAPAATNAALPAPSAGGDYAVNLGSFANAANAEGVVRSLKQAQLPGYSEPAAVNGRSGYRVRVGPYATRADAEAARLRAQQSRSDLRGAVVVLDAEPLTAKPASPSSTPTAVAKPSAAPPRTAASAPAASSSAPAPSAGGTGFAIQLGAFSKAADANALRDRMRAAGFSAFVEQVNTDKGALSRVRVGPVVGRGEADQLKTQIKAKTGMDGIVRPHP